MHNFNLFITGETMSLEDNLTNEKLGKKYGNTFDLVNDAINIARNLIRSGKEKDLEGKHGGGQIVNILNRLVDEKKDQSS